ncbi:MAG: hypothetical protein DI585_01095 [Pseudomonas fluorescens]|nr:MAG: hypothetical protein DI585_01095 [Pseudomonas fluorescens]
MLLLWPTLGRSATLTSLPVILNERQLTSLAVNDNKGQLYVWSADVWALLQPLLKPEEQTRLRPLLTTVKTWPLDEDRQGFKLTYNTQSVALDLSIPAATQATQHLALQNTRGVPTGKVIAPAKVSAYVNMYAAETRQKNMSTTNGRQPMRAEADGAINIKGWVAEAQAMYIEPRKGRTMTGNMGMPQVTTSAEQTGLTTRNRRLVKDDPTNMLRYQAGELSYPIAGLQRYRPLVGVGMARQFDLQPYRVTQPGGRTGFTLESTSTVDVYVNGNRLQTLQLPAGTYMLSDFPVVNGANNVELVITDAVGRVQRQSFPIISDGELLDKGLSRYAASAGVPQANSNDDNGAVFSGLWRYGLTDSLTVGTNFQGDIWQQVMGFEAGTAAPWGMLHGDFAFSRDGRRSSTATDILDWAARLDYRNILSPNGLDTWQTSLEYRGALFNLPADPKATNPYIATFSASYTRGFTPRLSLTLGGQQRFGRGSQRDDTRLTSNLLWRLDDEWSMNLDGLWSRNDGLGAMLGLTWSPYSPSAEAANTVVTSYDTRREVTRADWMRRPAQGQLGLETDLAVERRSTKDNTATTENTRTDLNGTATYTTDRGQIRLRQEATTAGLNADRTQSTTGTTTQFSVASALVFADGAFAVSRPVANSFALVDSNVPLGLNPHFDTHFDASTEDDAPDDATALAASPLLSRYEARNGTLGGAVLPDLSAYLYRQLNVDVLPDATT